MLGEVIYRYDFMGEIVWFFTVFAKNRERLIVHDAVFELFKGIDLFLLPKVTVGKLALAWGWLRKPMIPLVFLFTF
jgi:hypothetical protein